MPFYHTYGPHRLDLSSLTDANAAELVARRVEEIVSESDGGDEWLRRQLEELARLYPGITLDLLVAEPAYLIWVLWTLEASEVTTTSVRFRREGEVDSFELREDWNSPPIKVPSGLGVEELLEQLAPLVITDDLEALVEDEETLCFPFEWRSDEALLAGMELLRPCFGHVPTIAIVEVGLGPDRLRFVRLSDLSRPTDIARLQPWIEDRDRRARLEGLWRQHGIA